MRTGLSPHSFPTRLAHLALAVLVIAQVATSQFMTPPGDAARTDTLFEVHESGGLAALAVAFVFWVLVIIRDAGTEPAVLVPWLNSERRRNLLEDTKRHIAAWRRWQLAEHRSNGAFAGAIHGLGLLLVLLMALTGAFWFATSLIGSAAAQIGTLALDVHETLANLIIAYVVGHAGFAVVNHFARIQRLTDMWSLRKSRK